MRRSDYRAPGWRFLAAAARIAWRDLRGSRGRFLPAIAATACGVAALGGIHGALDVFDGVLARDLREAIAADLSVQTTEPPDAAQSAALDAVARHASARTFVVETTAQVASDTVPDPRLALAKVVDPTLYPFYGRVRLEPDIPLAAALTDDSVAVSDDLPGLLQVATGDRIEVNGVRLRVAALLRSQPDQLSITPTPLPKLLLSHAAGERAGLLRPRTAYYHRTLFRLPAGVDVASLRGPLERAFPGRKVLDALHPDPQAAGVLAGAGRFLRAVGVMVLLLGVLGMATALWAHLEQRLDAVAIVAALGGTWRHACAIHLLQTAGMAMAGSAVGAVGGMVLARLMAGLAPRLFGLAVEAPWNWRAPLTAAAIGWVTAVVVAAPVLLRVRSVRPYRILRRSMAEPGEAAPGETARERSAAEPVAEVGRAAEMNAAAPREAARGRWAAWLALIAAMAGLLLFATRSAVWAAAGTAALLGAGGALWGSASLAVALLRRAGGVPLPVAVRQGVGNVPRPGNHAVASMAALAGATTLVLLTYLMQQAAVSALRDNLPARSANLFLLNVEAAQALDFAGRMATLPGLEGPPLLAPFYSVRVLAVDGRPLPAADARLEEAGLHRRWLAATFSAKPGVVEVVEGRWWDAGTREVAVALPRMAAAALGAGVGSRLRFEVGTSAFEARVAAIDRLGPLDRLRCCFLFSPAAPAQPAAAWHGVVGVKPGAMAAVRRDLYRAFPTVTTVDARESIAMLEGWIERLLGMVRLAGLFALAAGALLMGTSVAATRQWRIEEMAVMKALGASRGRLLAVCAVEFSVTGGLAGAIGALVAGVAAALAWRIGGEGVVAWPGAGAVAGAVLGTAAVANLAGWLAVRRLLGLRPLTILREE